MVASDLFVGARSKAGIGDGQLGRVTEDLLMGRSRLMFWRVPIVGTGCA